MAKLDYVRPQPKETTNVRLDRIVVDKRFQIRSTLTNPKVVKQYAEDMRGGASFPPISIFCLPDSRRILADGFQRFHSALEVGYKEMTADIYKGSEEDALLFAASVDNAMGLVRSSEEKRQAAVVLIKAFPRSSARSIASSMQVSPTFIGNVKRELIEAKEIENFDKVTTANGREVRKPTTAAATVHGGRSSGQPCPSRPAPQPGPRIEAKAPNAKVQTSIDSGLRPTTTKSGGTGANEPLPGMVEWLRPADNNQPVDNGPNSKRGATAEPAPKSDGGKTPSVVRQSGAGPTPNPHESEPTVTNAKPPTPMRSAPRSNVDTNIDKSTSPPFQIRKSDDGAQSQIKYWCGVRDAAQKLTKDTAKNPQLPIKEIVEALVVLVGSNPRSEPVKVRTPSNRNEPQSVAS